MCENFDHGTPPKSTTVEMTYRARKTVAHPLPPAWSHDQMSASVVFATSERTNRSARTRRNGELPSAETSARRKNQNQYPPMHTMSAPMCHSRGKTAGVGPSAVG